jgi:DNA-binding transcriptional ArsR family regulator
MIRIPKDLDVVFEALANEHRREIIYVLSLQPCTISQLATMRALSLPAIHKHIKLLEKGGMILRKKIGRTNVLSLNRDALRAFQEWSTQFHAYWGSNAGSLENYAQYVSNAEPMEKEKKMKKFVLLSLGFETPTQEIQMAWGKWFQSIAEKIVDSGNPLGAGREITRDGTKELPLGRDSITGYLIINAENIDEAEKVAQTCPIITGMRVYEAMSM